jgi:hypothetical protein
MKAVALASALAFVAGPCLAACPIELSVYTGRDGAAAIEFRPAKGAAVTNAFRLIHGELALDGFVMWSEGIERPNGILSHQCPDGDVTGPEYDACTVWAGVIYTIDASGEVGLLPRPGESAPERLLFPDLAHAIDTFPDFSGIESKLSWDVFNLSGCQE